MHFSPNSQKVHHSWGDVIPDTWLSLPLLFFIRNAQAHLKKKNSSLNGSGGAARFVLRSTVKAWNNPPSINPIYCSKLKILAIDHLHQNRLLTSSHLLLLVLCAVDCFRGDSTHFIDGAQPSDTSYTLLPEFTLCRATRLTTNAFMY